METAAQEQLGLFGGLAKFMDEGGTFMYVILLVWIAAMVVAAERFIALNKYDVDAPSFMGKVRKFILDNEIQHAINLCSASAALIAGVFKEGLKRANQSRQQIQDVVESTIIEANSKAEQRLGAIALAANISTLLGLLGTISGLISSFQSLAGADPAEKAEKLTLGISTAMNTTMLGLISGISLLVMHSYLTGRVEKITSQIDQYSMRLIDVLGTKKNSEYDQEEAA